MGLIRNAAGNRVVDKLRQALQAGESSTPDSARSIDIATSEFSLFAFDELRDLLNQLDRTRLLVTASENKVSGLLGGDKDRHYRNRLESRRIARQCLEWLGRKVDVRESVDPLSQSTMIVRTRPAEAAAAAGAPSQPGQPIHAFTGSCPFTTRGLGLTPGNRGDQILEVDDAPNLHDIANWFNDNWSDASVGPSLAAANLAAQLNEIISPKAPAQIYHLILQALFAATGGALVEDDVIQRGTGIHNTAVWKKLYRFQRDGVIGAVDKLERHGGCIIADSVGLGKTFEALAVIKYYELRNDRVLVLCPKRLRDNWTVYRSNDVRNLLASDRFNYDVLNHTDLSRANGHSGDIDLTRVNWGNYDLVVIDESHNFRNNPPHRDRTTRYERLMRDIIKQGVRTKVLMLTATPVNNRLSDLRNQISFVTEGVETALKPWGIDNIKITLDQAQAQFNKWLRLPDDQRTPESLVERLGFDYFTLLDLLTIARSRKHIVKYYGTNETGRFPERLKPVNFKPDVDISGEFPRVARINSEIQHLNLGAYSPLSYVFESRLPVYEKRYGTVLANGNRKFNQKDREQSLIHLMRVNMLKRMESSVHSFGLTVARQLDEVDELLRRIDAGPDEIDGVSFDDIDDIESPDFESQLVGRKVKVLLKDVDLIKWRQDLQEDRNRLATLNSLARSVGHERDAKLAQLREMISSKVASPINPGNRKVLVFTAFADTAEYLYKALHEWARDDLGLHVGLLTGTGTNKSTIPGLHADFASILTAFSPRSKERAAELADEGEIDLLIATDCISEGQNLQDCDTLVNYDIHWNPVRIIQRFGRIDRLGSTNERVQLVNFWPNMQIEEYIGLERRVTGRMALLDVSATGEENLIESDSPEQMNDLEYRRKQLLRLQDAVIDLEDLSNGISIADSTLGDFRIDLATFARDNQVALNNGFPGVMAVTTMSAVDALDIRPGVVFCLKSVADAGLAAVDPSYPLAPHYMVHVGADGSVVLDYMQARRILDRLKRLCVGRDLPAPEAFERFDALTKHGRDMSSVTSMLAAAVASVTGKHEERATASIFRPGGTLLQRGSFAGADDFEVEAYLVIMPEVAD